MQPLIGDEVVVDKVDVIVIGAGASGLMCAATAAYRGKKVLLLDHANKAGKKILMSGGGRCNFTNMDAAPKHFLSDNPYFCISALNRFSPQDFVDLVDRHGLEYVEKTPGQLFCEHSAKDILAILLTELDWSGAELKLNTKVHDIEFQDKQTVLKTSQGEFACESLVVATGGLSIPTMGATGLGYDIAKQVGHSLLPTRASLVPITVQPDRKGQLAALSGIACDVSATANGVTFQEPMLFTHRGVSGPAILQITNFWQPGEALSINISPTLSLKDLFDIRQNTPKKSYEGILSALLPKRLVELIKVDFPWLTERSAQTSNEQVECLFQYLANFDISPNGTEGYRTAEVTLGGVNTNEVSSKTFESQKQTGLYFIGEVLDVTGWLGGYNFQWAWASGYCAGLHV
ncbi:NAD(P)/FAD-dependent oxidoreductase [Marinomonas sp. M1K-6]|uniref:NAD(P)/FAD-dependent oxidoreductase n=1 Tax=Marinomonas profundi TaxID=2726122 RepID=A0A847RC78_9GAMM|nr:NAD(P)/FAD-dependent oxidoreductase [Marinomonas profundi]NLQ18897.1 NAD(P)/FAD-dependent oxidoreductase [Marinomonas profundi]UDV02832.1 NAD(P)/FAD-dependent oxidoreductase [Marinomonas profundi]